MSSSSSSSIASSTSPDFFFRADELMKDRFVLKPEYHDYVSDAAESTASENSVSTASLNSSTPTNLHTLPDVLFQAIVWPLDANTLLGLVDVDAAMELRVKRAEKYWGIVDTVPEGYIVDYEFVPYNHSLSFLCNATIGKRDEEYIDKLPLCRGLQDLPLALLRIVADGLDDKSFFPAAKAYSRFVCTGHVVGEYSMTRVSIRGLRQPDGSKKTVIRVDRHLYDDVLTAWLINNARDLDQIVFDATITYFPEGICLPDCEHWELLPIETQDPIWPGLINLFKRKCRKILHLRGEPTDEAMACWGDLLKNGGATNRKMRGWITAEVYPHRDEYLRKCLQLIPFNGRELSIMWSRALHIFDGLLDAACAMPLLKHQRIRISFWPHLSLEQLIYLVRNQFRWTMDIGDDEFFHTSLGRKRQIDVKIGREYLLMMGRGW